MAIAQAHKTDSGSVYALTPSPVDKAMDAARAGHVAWLTEQEREVLAVLPAGLAHAALEALEDAEEDAWAKRMGPVIDTSRARRAAGEKGIPWGTLRAEIDAELAETDV